MLRNDLYKPWFVGEDWGIEIIDGEFSGVSIQITKLKFSESDEAGLDVEYHVVHKPDTILEGDVKGDLFSSTLELIVNDIVEEAVKTFENEQTRNNDSQESDQ